MYDGITGHLNEQLRLGERMNTPDKTSDLGHIGRRMVQNQSAFSLNNIMRIRELFKFSSPKFEEVFQTIPVLLQINQPLIPGYIESPGAPCGIYGFNQSGFSRLDQGIVKKFKIDRRQIRSSHSAIESLFLLGESDPTGYSTSSDLDYWVCVDLKKLSADEVRQLKLKLDLITRWSKETGDIDVNFFLIDPYDLGSLGARPDSDEEAVGFMPSLVKEEAYRSLLHLVGRAPLWWVMPFGMNSSEYERISKNLNRIPNPNFFPQDFIDLGFPHAPSPKECFSAALWLLRQAVSDPFRAVIKIVLILEQTEASFSLPLLCDEMKRRVFTEISEQFPIDPDILTSLRVLDFCRTGLSNQDAELIRTAVFFNLYTPFRAFRRRGESRKDGFLGEAVTDWGWNPSKIENMKNYTSWPISQKLYLHEEFNSLLKDLYTKVSVRIRTDFPDLGDLESQDLAQLHLRMLADQSNFKAKIEDLPSNRFRLSLSRNLIIVFEKNQWHIYSGAADRAVLTDEQRLIYSTPRAARAAAWMVHNRLWHPRSDLHLRVDPWVQMPQTINALLSKLAELFPPIQSRDVQYKEQSAQAKSAVQLLVVNMEEPGQPSKLESAELIYRTALGELCHEVLEIKPGQDETEKYLALAAHMTDNGQDEPADIYFFIPASSEKAGLEANLKNVFQKHIPSEEMNGQTGRRTSKLRLDKD
ncbi:MAG: class I adenylate cyclase [Deltaproteobacteria bacterium]|nr:class I adenylate cyclase [Deltaproteobacteria bacterium]